MNDTKLLDYLRGHAEKQPVSFHMPGHKGPRFFREAGYGWFLDHIAECDITEIPGADNLFQPEGVIAGVMERYRKLYDADQAYLLVGGATAGIAAGLLAAGRRGGSVIMARNCHKSVFNVLSYAGMRPVFAFPDILEEEGITGPVRPEEIRRVVREHPDADAVIVTSPNYNGVLSDIRGIADIAHENGMPLIVDQAHGAHLRFFDEQEGTKYAAESLGADFVIMSTHKTLGSFTQSAVACLYGDRIPRERVEDALQKVQSSSPSYLLMSSLEINAEILERDGAERIRAWREDLDWFYREAAEIPGVRMLGVDGSEDLRDPGSAAEPEVPEFSAEADLLLDRSKINLDLSALGLSGGALDEELRRRGIFPEMVSGDGVLLLTGIGNRRYDYERLIAAVSEIANERIRRLSEAPCCVRKNRESGAGLLREINERSFRLPYRGIPEHAVRIPAEEAAGRAAAAALTPYPPGTPAVCPGEVPDRELLRLLLELRRRGISVMGIDEDGRILVGETAES
ncbi:MAG: aminotransferase class I/II-fold pyridoxal phosphate-dependent enzyme [Anaerovoracaceae bacterium]|jgi:arginine/lysine/ornithine decarboxylase